MSSELEIDLKPNNNAAGTAGTDASATVANGSFTDAQGTHRFVKVQNATGLHARPAASIVRIGNKYPEIDIRMRCGDEIANAKSIMGVMMLAAGQGSEVEFIAHGPANRVNPLLDEIEAAFNNKFGEN